jgi:hypothetical protein
VNILFQRLHALRACRVCGLILLAVLTDLLVSRPLQADVGPRPILPVGSNIAPDEETPIQMASEIVVMTVRPAIEADNSGITLNPDWYGFSQYPVWFPAVAEVEADFTMKNPTSDAISMTVWFPLASVLESDRWSLEPAEVVPRLESFQVSIDGNPVEYGVSLLPNPEGFDKPPLPWASFSVTFPAEKETPIQVSYVLPLQLEIKTWDMMALHYIFQTGAGWAGTIGQAELILNLPYPASAETLAGMLRGGEPISLPSGGILEGNQARWTWQDFEPGAQDDFSISLLSLATWQKVETARAAVQANPEDGQAWLDLADVYFHLAIYYHLRDVYSDHYVLRPATFGFGYIPLGLEAYQRAADLLPEYPTPHVGLGVLNLMPYINDKNASPEVIQFAQDKLQLARELEDKDPMLAGILHDERYPSSSSLANTLEDYFRNDATATAEWVAWHTQQAQTMIVEPATPTRKPTLTATLIRATTSPPTIAETIPATVSHTTPPLPTRTTTVTPAPSVTPSPRDIENIGTGQGQVIVVVIGVIGLVVVSYLALKRLRKRR